MSDDETADQPIRLSVIVKALNEEANIARTIEAALAETKGRAAEIIIADSASTDRTVEIARRYPVEVVVLENPASRSCGVGAQLGYQNAKGEYLYVIDGDMQMLPDFLDRAIARLEADPSLAGVGGLIMEAHVPNADCARRDEATRKRIGFDEEVDGLFGGGLYRRSAIRSVGYLTNPNLHSNEELELGIRLKTAGWRMERLGIPSVLHYGHTLPDWELHGLRWRSRYCWGLGELLRSAWGTPYFGEVVSQRNLMIYGGVVGYWVVLVALVALGVSPLVLVLGPLLLIGAMAARKRSLSFGLHNVVNWHLWALGTLGGLLRPQVDPRGAIPSKLFN